MPWKKIGLSAEGLVPVAGLLFQSRSALGVSDAPTRVEELARLGGFERLRALGIPEDELGDVAVEIAQRPGARANPRPANAQEIEELLRSIW